MPRELSVEVHCPAGFCSKHGEQLTIPVPVVNHAVISTGTIYCLECGSHMYIDQAPWIKEIKH